MEERYTYIRIYGLTGTPHLLPSYVPDRLLLKEIAYQTGVKGIVVVLASMSKKVWPTFPIHLSPYIINNVPHAHVEAHGLEELCLLHGSQSRHDPTGVIKAHCLGMRLSRLYQHDDLLDDSISRGAQSYDEVLARIEKLKCNMEQE